MKKKLSAEILEKYLKGECDENEIAQINSWYNSFELDQDDISTLPDDQQKVFKLLMWNNIKENIKSAEGENAVYFNDRRSARLRTFIYLISGIAAILCIIFFIKNNAPNNAPAENKEEIVVSNLTSAIHKITLSDGSMVWLSPKSRLSYFKVFGKHSRETSMSGEAFFEVTKDHKRPFLIYSENVVTKVWGTSFRIQSNNGGITKVDVITGKVSVSISGFNEHKDESNKINQTGTKQEIMLLPNEEATYNRRLNYLEKNEEIKDQSINIWKKTTISFDNTPMPEVFKMLNERFKVHIWSNDRKVNKDYLKADFTDESFPAIMEMMEKTLNVSYRVNGNEFVLESTK